MVVSGRRSDHRLRLPRFRIPDMGLCSRSGSIPVSLLPAPAAEPCFARNVRARACARLRALRGGAVRAPDCACAHARGTDARPLELPSALCHGLSCFVMVRMWATHRPWSFRAGAPIIASGLPRFRVPGMGLCSRSGSIPVSLLPAPAAEPCFARNVRARACARQRALRGGAVRAPDCACAREGQTPGARLPQVPVVLFLAPARNGRQRGPADAVPCLPSRSYHGFSGVKP